MLKKIKAWLRWQLEKPWRTMESAPRDGRDIIALFDNHFDYEPVVVFHVSKDHDYPWHTRDGNGFPTERLAYWKPCPGYEYGVDKFES